MKRVFAGILILLFISGTVLYAQNTDKITVYITNTGGKYHKATCGSLKKSKIPIALEDAKKRGYEPCKVCKP